MICICVCAVFVRGEGGRGRVCALFSSSYRCGGHAFVAGRAQEEVATLQQQLRDQALSTKAGEEMDVLQVRDSVL